MGEFFKNYKDLYDANPKSYRVFLEGVTNVIADVALYVTLAVIATLLVWAIAIRNRDEQYLASARRVMLGIVIGYSVGVITVLGALRLYAEILAKHVTWHAWLVVGLFALLAVAIITTTVLNKKNFKGSKWVALGFAVAILAYSVVVLCVVKPLEADYAPQTSWLMYLLSAILVAAIVTLALVFGDRSSYNTKAITYAAICISASFALSYIKLFSLPQGGSVTFASLLPLALYSYMFGTRKGVVAGVVYGLLQFVQSPQFYQPMQVMLDYPIAFGAIGLAGIGRKMKLLKGSAILQFIVGTTIAVLFRYVAHVMSGYFVFYTWAAWAGYSNALLYSVVYNTFTLADLAIVLVAGVLVLLSNSFKRIALSANEQPSAADATTEQQPTEQVDAAPEQTSEN